MRVFLIFFLFTISGLSNFAQVSIGTPVPHPSAQLDVSSTTKGLLPPRMTSMERDAIASPSPGLMIFNTTTQRLEIFATSGGWYGIQTEVPERKLLGSSSGEQAYSIQQTSDLGYIVAGTTYNYFPNGDITDSGKGGLSGGPDFWIVKLDAQRNIEWNKVYGGEFDDFAYNIQQTFDGGYIVAGYSRSSASGDVTGINHGSSDYWILKLNSDGNISWQKLMGGSGSEEAFAIQQTTDYGYIIAGRSNSSENGDVTGTTHGMSDYWIVKLNEEGTIIWQQLLGGSASEIPASIQQTEDEGYIIAGYSLSSESGDVSGTNHGDLDYWIVKLTWEGYLDWEKLLGGDDHDKATSIKQTSDGGYIVAGYSGSSANGDVTGTNHGGMGTYDYWIIKLNASGSINWNKLLGGGGSSPSDFAQSIIQTRDGKYVVAGYSSCSAIGDITAVNHGGLDYWIVKLDVKGVILWNKLLGGNSNDEAFSIIETIDGGYIVAGHSSSSANGNVNSLNHGLTDVWIIKLDINGILF